MERIGVSYKIKKETKAGLDTLKKKHSISATDIIDTILSFDKDSLRMYIDIMNLLHNPKGDYNLYNTSNGSLILNKEHAAKTLHAELDKYSIEEIDEIVYFQEYDELINKKEIVKKQDIDERLDEYNKTQHTMKKLFILMDKRMNKLEKALKANGIDPDKVEIDD